MDKALKERQAQWEAMVEELLDEAIRGVVLQQQKYSLSEVQVRRMLMRLCDSALRAGVGEARVRLALARWGFTGVLEWCYTGLDKED